MLASVEQTHAVTQARIAAADADADRQLRVAARRQQLAVEQRAARRRETGEAEAVRREQRAVAASARQMRRAAVIAGVAGLVRLVRERGVAVYAAVMYLLAVGGAVYGQISAATDRGWPLLVGVVIAAAVEGLALVMALTAQQLRLQGEAARLPRALTWLCAGFASAINYAGHADLDRTGAVLLAALSAAGIVVWEVRSGAAHRAELRHRGLLPDPPASFGWRRWCRYLPSTAAAWSLDIRSRVSPRAAALLAQVAAEDQARHIAHEAGQTRRLAHRAVRTALRRGESGSVLAALTWLAAHGTIPPQPALPTSPASETTTGPTIGRPSVGSADDLRPFRRDEVRPGRRRLRAETRRTGRTRQARRLRSRRVRSGRAATGPGMRVAAGAGTPSDAHRALEVGQKETTAGEEALPAHANTRRTAAGRRVRSGPAVGSRPDNPRGRQRPDVSDLIPVGRQIRDQFAAQDLALSRAALVTQLRAAGVPVSTDRASALLAALTTDPAAADDTAPPSR